MKSSRTVPAAILVAALAGSACATETGAGTAGCVDTSPVLDHMEEATVTIVGEKPAEIPVRVADDSFERAAGFQYICPKAVAETAILFRFDAPTQSPFHMNNVHAPLDIAFIGPDGVVVDVQRMEPYVDSVLFVRQRLYQSTLPFLFALETAAGRMETLGIGIGTRLKLQ